LLNSSYKINAPDCICEEVEGDLIVINLLSGRYYNMRGASVIAWNAIIAGVAPSQLIKASDLTAEQLIAFEHYTGVLVKEELIVTTEQESTKVDVLPLIIHDEASPFQVDIFSDMEEMLRLDPIHEADANLGWPHKA